MFDGKKGGGPAFPVPGYAGTAPGMTLRDYIAIHAMQTALTYRRAQFETDNPERDDWDWFIQEILAPEAYRIADAMLEAREKPPA